MNRWAVLPRFPDVIMMDGGRGQVNICDGGAWHDLHLVHTGLRYGKG